MCRLVSGVLLLFAVLATSSRPALGQDPSTAPLRPGDRIVLKIWLDTTFADTVRIDERGAATLPRIGPVSFANVAAPLVADSVRSAYSTLTRTPAVEVTPLRRVTVGGEVAEPGVYYLETRATLREAVAAAGGITDIGSTGRVLLMRNAAEISVDRWERRSDPEVVVQSSDVVWVRREPWLRRNVFSVISGAGVLVSVILSLTR